MARVENIEYQCDECATSEPAQAMDVLAPSRDGFTIPENWLQVVFSRAVTDDFAGKRLARMFVKHYCPECVEAGIDININES